MPSANQAEVVFVVPIAPALTGNGLAMRAGMWLECLAERAPVDLVVVPVSGSPELGDWAGRMVRNTHVVDVPTHPADMRTHAVAQLADPRLRERFSETHPLPERARRAPASLAASVQRRLGCRPDGVVVVMREYLAPFGVHLAAIIGARRVAVDLDDDAETVLRQLGQRAEADAYGRLARAWLPDADAVTAASPIEARSMSRRYGLVVTPVPNAIRVPAAPVAPPGCDRLLYVGNLTYEPNIAAVTELVEKILPRIRAHLPGATAVVVGPADRRVDALRDRPGVVITGAVPDVRPYYEAADLVVVPLRAGAGTRLKVLEAIAHRRPVLATATAVAGLGLGPDDVALAEDPAGLASRAVELLRRPGATTAMVEGAFATVSSSRTVEAVAATVRSVAFGSSIPFGIGESSSEEHPQT